MSGSTRPLSGEPEISYGAAMTDTVPFRVGRVLLGLLYALVAHAIVLGVAVATVRLTPPGEGFADLAAFLSVLIIGELVVLAGALIVSTVLLVRRKRDLATGLLVGGFLGVIAGLVIRFLP
jgi:hypothetical protein